MKPALVRFPPDVLERIDALVGSRNRPRFIREAVAAELQRRERYSENATHPREQKAPLTDLDSGDADPL